MDGNERALGVVLASPLALGPRGDDLATEHEDGADAVFCLACAAGHEEGARALLPQVDGGSGVYASDFAAALGKEAAHGYGAGKIDALSAAALLGSAHAVEFLARSGKFSQARIDKALWSACVAALPSQSPIRRAHVAGMDEFMEAAAGALALLPFASAQGAIAAESALSERGIIARAVWAIFAPSGQECVARIQRMLLAPKGSAMRCGGAPRLGEEGA